MKYFSMIALLVLSALQVGCADTACEGEFTYTPDDWRKDDRWLLQSTADYWNEFTQSSLVTITPWIPSEHKYEIPDACHITPGKPMLDGDEKAGRYFPMSGNIVINDERLRELYVPWGMYDQALLVTILHEVGHALKFKHVDNEENIMYPELTWVYFNFGDQDKQQCIELGYCK